MYNHTFLQSVYIIGPPDSIKFISLPRDARSEKRGIAISLS